MDLRRIKKVHFTGIKGVGMAALAFCAQDLGLEVSGSDVKEEFVTDAVLERRGIKWQTGFSPENIPEDTDLLIFTGAHGGEANREVVAAQQKGVVTFSHAQALARFMKGKIGISTCGVGGKTTTASMIAILLQTAGLNPSFAIGAGEIFPLGFPGRFNEKGKAFVAEADEYATSPSDRTPRFMFQKPKIVVLTNIEHDHPDVYPNIKSTLKAFRNFIVKLSSDCLLVACLDNKNVANLIQSIKVPVKTYGFCKYADWQIIDWHLEPGKTVFSLRHKGDVFKDLTLKVPGRFNILNATASFVVGNFLGLKFDKLKQGLLAFLGTERRFEKVAEVGKVLLYDDYAHHPLEIKATLKAAKSWFNNRKIVVIFQPHTYSRTKFLLTEFADSFQDADQIIITKIYASAREKADLQISGAILAQEIAKRGKKVCYQAGCQAVCRFLEENIKAGDVIFTLGAGDIFLWHDKIINNLKCKIQD